MVAMFDRLRGLGSRHSFAYCVIFGVSKSLTTIGFNFFIIVLVVLYHWDTTFGMARGDFLTRSM